MSSWRLKKEQLIVSYSKEIFDKYCRNFIEYVYNTTDLYGDCGQKRALNPTWSVDGGVYYFDFVTREKVNVKLD